MRQYLDHFKFWIKSVYQSVANETTGSSYTSFHAF